LLFGYAVYV
nr:Chain C, TAX PEPTIDE P6A [synthetic construct]